MSKNVLVIGGAGYVGTELVFKLLDKGYNVTVYDLLIYGSNFNISTNLEVVKGDIRDISKLSEYIKNKDAIIHLACISNDPSYELNPQLSKDINFTFFEPLIKVSKDNGVKRFIYASSSSVYGLKEDENVNEDASLKPLTDYSKYKARCEEILLKYGDDNFTTSVIRPATVCGYSRRQRLDLVVNILTNHAYNNRKILIFGGDQLRPNIHIKDMVNAYLLFLEVEKSKISNEIFNVGYYNHPIIELANIVKKSIGNDVELVTSKTDDMRSYHISSNKIFEQLNFENKYDIKDAVIDLKIAFEKNLFKDPLNNIEYFNIKKMQNIKLK